MATETSNAPPTASEAEDEGARGAVWAALDEAVRLGVSGRSGWWLGLLVPTFAIRLLPEDGAVVTDRLGHFNPMPAKSWLEFEAVLPLLAPAGVLFSLIWIRLQGQALAALLIGMDRRVGAFREGSEVTGGQLWSAASPIARDCFWVLTARYALALLSCIAAFAVPVFASRVMDVIDGPQSPVYPLLAIFVAFGFLYLATLEVATNLALVSVVSNRRGPLSAFQHAWKLMTASPREALRAGLAHFSIILAVVAVVGAIESQVGPGGPVTFTLILLAMGSGVTHACLWDRVYSTLGGVRALPPLEMKPDQRPKRGSKGETAAASG